MNIEILISGPRKNGNTFILSKHLSDMLNGSGVCSNISYLYDYEIKPCIDCRACKQKEKIYTLKDDAKILFERIDKIEMFKRMFKALGVKYLCTVTTKAYDVGDAIKNEATFKNLLALSEKLIRI